MVIPEDGVPPPPEAAGPVWADPDRVDPLTILADLNLAIDASTEGKRRARLVDLRQKTLLKIVMDASERLKGDRQDIECAAERLGAISREWGLPSLAVKFHLRALYLLGRAEEARLLSREIPAYQPAVRAADFSTALKMPKILAMTEPGQPLAVRLRACGQLVREGRLDEAEERLADLVTHPEVGAEARKLLAASRQLRRWGVVAQFERFVARQQSEPEGSDPDFVAESEVVVARRPGAREAIFVFTGKTRQLWVSVHLLQQMLPDDCHIVYLSDESRSCYLDGVDGLGSTYAESLEGMKSLLRSLGDPKVYCIGTSASGLPALRFGFDLNAAGVLAFSAVTQTKNIGLYVEGSRYADAAKRSPEMAVDIRELYDSRPNPPRVIAVYGARHAVDSFQSLQLEGLEGATLVPLDYDGHQSLGESIALGLFPDLVQSMLGRG